MKPVGPGAQEPSKEDEPLSDAVIGPDTPPDPKDAFSLLIEGATEYAVFTLSPGGIISTWNRGAQRIKGYRSEEVIGRHFSLFYPAEDRDAGLPDRLLAEALRSGRVGVEGWRVRKDGTRFWASVMIVPLRDDAGRLRGFAKLTRDESDRRAAGVIREKMALMAEQERIASELAGTIVHRLFGVGLGLNGALQLAHGHPDLAKRIQTVTDQVDETIRELRSVVFDISRARGGGPTARSAEDGDA